jgi:hypothetical protein
VGKSCKSRDSYLTGKDTARLHRKDWSSGMTQAVLPCEFFFSASYFPLSAIQQLLFSSLYEENLIASNSSRIYQADTEQPG